MVYRKYSEFLPSYLDGENIRRHSMILEKSDQELYNQIQLLSLWNCLERPVLIEKVQTEPAIATFNVYVNMMNPIRSVQGTSTFATINEEYDEEELVTSQSFTVTDTSDTPVVNSGGTITVETYDGQVYVKGYPENDTVMNDNRDHDIFLDRIGALLGLPRRTYTEQRVGQDVTLLKQLYPPFFTKGRPLGTPYTEDDYYYYLRLTKFVEQRGTKPLPVLMAELLYEWNDVTYSNMSNRNTSITEDIEEYIGQPVLQITNNKERYLNIDYTNMQSILEQYYSITRTILLSEQKTSYADIYSTGDMYPAHTDIHVDTVYEDNEGNEGALYNAPFRLIARNLSTDMESVVGEYRTDDTGSIDVIIAGLPPTDVRITAQPIDEYEFKASTDLMSTDVSVDNFQHVGLDYVTGGQYAGTNISQLQQPSIYAQDLLYVGRRYLCLIPMVDPRICDLSSYYVSVDFRYTHNYQKLGLVNVRRNADGTYTQTTAWITPYTLLGGWGNYDDVHTLEADWVDGTMYYYVDGEYTGISQNWNNRTDMIYLAGYNINENKNGNNVGLFLDNINVYDSSQYGNVPEYDGGGYEIISYMDTSKWTMEDFSEDEIIERTVDGIRELYLPEGEFEENSCYCEIQQSTEYHFNITFRIDSQRSELYITNDLCISTSLKAYTNARKWETFPQFVFEVGKWYNLNIILQNNGQLIVNGQNITLHPLFKREYSLKEGVSIREYTVATKNTQQ